MNESDLDWGVRFDFTDILRDRRSTSDFAWASRKWNPVFAYLQPHSLEGDQLKSVILKSPYLNHVLNKIHNKVNVPVDRLYAYSVEILDEIGCDRQISIIRWFSVFVSKILKKVYTSIYVNEEKFIEMRSQMGNNPVLFVPTHRSYGDFVLMAFICFHYNLDIPKIAAGMDFASMAIMGNLLRKSCTFFIRRSFNNDELYSSLFSYYVFTLVTRGKAAIEFFIEGTRSRSSKSLVPKYGFLSMALKPFFFGLIPDISIVPVNLCYDKILEEVLFAYELLGIPKPKESTKGFLKALSFVNQSHGNVYANFGDPLSVKEYFGSKIDRSIHYDGPTYIQELSSNEFEQIVSLAHAIVTIQKELTTLNYFNLIALILNNHIITSLEPISIDLLLIEIKWIISVLRVMVPAKSLLVNDVTKEAILEHLFLHKPLIFLTNEEKIQLGKIYVQNMELDSKQLRGHLLRCNTLDFAIPAIMLQIYVNPCTPFLINICFIAFVICYHGHASKDSAIAIEKLFSEFKFLCEIFSHEFVIHKENIQEDFNRGMRNAHSLKIIRVDNGVVSKAENNKLNFFCINFLSSYVTGYVVVAEVLLEFSGATLQEGIVIKACQERVEKKLLANMDFHPNNLSLEVLKNAFQSFVSMGAITKQKGKVVTYVVNENELKIIHSKLSTFYSCYRPKCDFSQQFSNFVQSSL